MGNLFFFFFFTSRKIFFQKRYPHVLNMSQSGQVVSTCGGGYIGEFENSIGYRVEKKPM